MVPELHQCNKEQKQLLPRTIKTLQSLSPQWSYHPLLQPVRHGHSLKLNTSQSIIQLRITATSTSDAKIITHKLPTSRICKIHIWRWYKTMKTMYLPGLVCGTSELGGVLGLGGIRCVSFGTGIKETQLLKYFKNWDSQEAKHSKNNKNKTTTKTTHAFGTLWKHKLFIWVVKKYEWLVHKEILLMENLCNKIKRSKARMDAWFGD